MGKTIEILDTTFRDGIQHGGDMKISLTDALGIIRQMAQMGFSVAELGFACSSDFSRDLIKSAMKEDLGKMKIAAFGRTRKRQQQVQDSDDVKAILKLEVPVAVIVCKSRLLDVTKSLEATPGENLLMIYDTVSYLKAKGLQVFLDLEHAVDAYYGRGEYGEYQEADERQKSVDYLYEVIDIGLRARADCLVVCDTVGGASPKEVAMVIDYFKKASGVSGLKIGFHGHNDNDLAVANSWAAVLAGATQVQGTINGYGERAGNANLCSLILRLQLKDNFEILSPEGLTQMTHLATRTAIAFGRELSSQAPFVSPVAFTTFAGMHAVSEIRDEGSYLQCRPETVGNRVRFGVNRQSGRSNVSILAESLGVPLTAEQVAALMKQYSLMIDGGGFEVSETSFRIACLRIRGEMPNYFAIYGYEVESGYRNEGKFAQATVKVGVGEKEEHTVADGDGPVDALSKTLKKALRLHYPVVDQIHLRTYNLHALDVGAKETSAMVRVLAEFSCQDESWEIAGVSSDSNEAALMALVDGIHWLLFKQGNGSKHLS